MLNIALIGCTGSIGRQVASVVRRDPQRFRFSALCAGHDGEELLSLCREFRPEFAALAAGDPGRAGDVPQGTHFLGGAEIAEHIFEGCDVAFIAAGGFAGLAYTLRAAETCRRIALANKESLVCGGQLVMDAIARTGAELIPVDSEHSAIFQALSFHRHAPFSRIVLTASGGPFRTWPKERLRSVTARDALRHPTWKMGDKITVDSATLLNISQLFAIADGQPKIGGWMGYDLHTRHRDRANVTNFDGSLKTVNCTDILYAKHQKTWDPSK